MPPFLMVPMAKAEFNLTPAKQRDPLAHGGKKIVGKPSAKQRNLSLDEPIEAPPPKPAEYREDFGLSPVDKPKPKKPRVKPIEPPPTKVDQMNLDLDAPPQPPPSKPSMPEPVLTLEAAHGRRHTAGLPGISAPPEDAPSPDVHHAAYSRIDPRTGKMEQIKQVGSQPVEPIKPAANDEGWLKDKAKFYTGKVSELENQMNKFRSEGKEIPTDLRQEHASYSVLHQGIQRRLAGSKKQAAPVKPTGAPTSRVPPSQAVYSALDSMTEKLPPGSLIHIPELRRQLHLSKEEFDSAVLALSKDSKVVLHHHDYPGSLPQEKRDELVQAPNGAFFMGIAKRKSQ